MTIRYYPARQPNQDTETSQLNYRMFAIPYHGSFDEKLDYSPYTACGVEKIGYPLYVNKQGIELLDVDEQQIKDKGYIEVTSN